MSISEYLKITLEIWKIYSHFYLVSNFRISQNCHCQIPLSTNIVTFLSIFLDIECPKWV